MSSFSKKMWLSRQKVYHVSDPVCIVILHTQHTIRFFATHWEGYFLHGLFFLSVFGVFCCLLFLYLYLCVLKMGCVNVVFVFWFCFVFWEEEGKEGRGVCEKFINLYKKQFVVSQSQFPKSKKRHESPDSTPKVHQEENRQKEWKEFRSPRLVY